MRWGLFNEIFVMSVDTLRTNKMRSGLTVLGIVIGITSIVGMTSLIRGFAQSLRNSIASLGPDTITVAKFSGLSMAAGNDFQALLMRPNMTPEDAEAIAREAPSIAIVDIMLGDGGAPTQERVYYRNLRTKMINVLGTTERWPDVVRVPLAEGRFFTSGEVERRRAVVVLGQTAVQALFPNQDAVGKTVRIGIV